MAHFSAVGRNSPRLTKAFPLLAALKPGVAHAVSSVIIRARGQGGLPRNQCFDSFDGLTNMGVDAATASGNCFCRAQAAYSNDTHGEFENRDNTYLPRSASHEQIGGGVWLSDDDDPSRGGSDAAAVAGGESREAAMLPEGFARPCLPPNPTSCSRSRSASTLAAGSGSPRLNYGNWQATGKDRIVILEDTDGDGRSDKRTVFYEGLQLHHRHRGRLRRRVGRCRRRTSTSSPIATATTSRTARREVLLRRLRLQGEPAQPRQRLHLGAGRLALRRPRPHQPVGRRPAGHARRQAHPLRRRRLSHSSDAARLRDLRRRHHQPVGRRLRRLRPVLRLELRDPAPLPHDPGRALRAVAEPAVEPVRLRTPADHRRPPALRRRRAATRCAANGRDAGDGRRPRPLRHADLPRRQLARRVTATRVFMCNIHGHRINHDILKRKGSGYVASHGKDFMIAADPWFMGVTLRTGPDGSVYVSDWSDTGECHTYKPHTTTRAASTRSATASRSRCRVDLAKLSDDELVKLQLHTQRLVRPPRPAAVAGTRGASRAGRARRSMRRCAKMLARRNWTRRSGCGRCGRCTSPAGWTPARSLRLLDDRSEHVRAWAIQLLCEDREPADEALDEVREHGAERPVAGRAAYLASRPAAAAAGRRWAIAEGLLSHAEDADDANLPLMYWYGIEPLVPADAGALRLAAAAGFRWCGVHGRRLVDAVLARGKRDPRCPGGRAGRGERSGAARHLLQGARRGLARPQEREDAGRAGPALRPLARSEDPAIRGAALPGADLWTIRKALADLRRAPRLTPPAVPRAHAALGGPG